MRNYMKTRRIEDIEFKETLYKNMRPINIKRNRSYKNTIYEKLGGYQCVCKGKNCWHKGKCKIKDERVLQLDHKKGGGSTRKKHLRKGGTSTYTYYRKHLNEIKKDLQVLCSNCNWAKRYNKKEYSGRPRKY